MAARFFLLEAIKQKGGHHQDKKDDYLAAFLWRGSAMELIKAYSNYCWR